MPSTLSCCAAAMPLGTRRRTFQLGCWTLLILSASAGWGQDSATPEEAPGPSRDPARGIHTGFVIVDGLYVAPPYYFEYLDNGIAINGHPITRARSDDEGPGFAPMGPRRWFGRGRWAGPNAVRPASSEAPLDEPPPRRFGWGHERGYQRELQNNALLISCADQNPEVFELPQSAAILSTLLSDESIAKKLATLSGSQFGSSLTPSHWEQIFTRLEATTELRARVAVLVEQEATIFTETRAATDSSRWYQTLASPSSKYGITLAAMVLSVVATGNLLLFRPQPHGRWFEKSEKKEDGIALRRIVIILALLGAFDLLLTLAAQKAGGFLELNPIGSKLITSPLWLATFKLTSLVFGCTILLKLKDYRAAQMAAWWLCLICTLLTFRWVTFNSLFFS